MRPAFVGKRAALRLEARRAADGRVAFDAAARRDAAVARDASGRLVCGAAGAERVLLRGRAAPDYLAPLLGLLSAKRATLNWLRARERRRRTCSASGSALASERRRRRTVPTLTVVGRVRVCSLAAGTLWAGTL